MKMKKPRMIAQGRMLEIISTPKFVVKRSLWGWRVLFLMNQPCDISSTSVMQDGWGRVTALLWCLSQLVRGAWAIGPPAVVSCSTCSHSVLHGDRTPGLQPWPEGLVQLLHFLPKSILTSEIFLLLPLRTVEDGSWKVRSHASALFPEGLVVVKGDCVLHLRSWPLLGASDPFVCGAGWFYPGLPLLILHLSKASSELFLDFPGGPSL